MSETTKKRKFNIIDLIVILVIVAAIAFVGFKFLAPGGTEGTSTETFYVTFYGEEVADFVIDEIELGADVYDEGQEKVIGKVHDIEISDGISYATTDEGQSVITSREGYSALKVVAEVEATEFSNGIIVGSMRYGVGHTMTMRAGYAKMYLRVSDIQRADGTDAE